MKRIFCIFVMILLIGAVCAINEGVSVYSSETSITFPTTAPIYVYNESSINEIVTDDKSGKIKIKPLDKKGKEMNEVDIKSLPQDKNTVANIEIQDTSKVQSEHMIVQIKPNSKLIISADGKSRKQTTDGKNPVFDIVYGLKKSSSVPWEYQSRVIDCDTTSCNVLFAEFQTRNVWIESRPLSEVMGMVESDTIPVYEALL